VLPILASSIEHAGLRHVCRRWWPIEDRDLDEHGSSVAGSTLPQRSPNVQNIAGRSRSARSRRREPGNPPHAAPARLAADRGVNRPAAVRSAGDGEDGKRHTKHVREIGTRNAISSDGARPAPHDRKRQAERQPRMPATRRPAPTHYNFEVVTNPAPCAEKAQMPALGKCRRKTAFSLRVRLKTLLRIAKFSQHEADGRKF
jgi:hypothetical protein